jgi:hypothetical protein
LILVTRSNTNLGHGPGVICCPDRYSDFVAIPWRWAIEQALGPLVHHRRLACAYEILPARSEAVAHPGMTDLMTRHLAGEAVILRRDLASRDQALVPV